MLDISDATKINIFVKDDVTGKTCVKQVQAGQIKQLNGAISEHRPLRCGSSCIAANTTLALVANTTLALAAPPLLGGVSINQTDDDFQRLDSAPLSARDRRLVSQEDDAGAVDPANHILKMDTFQMSTGQAVSAQRTKLIQEAVRVQQGSEVLSEENQVEFDTFCTKVQSMLSDFQRRNNLAKVLESIKRGSPQIFQTFFEQVEKSERDIDSFIHFVSLKQAYTMFILLQPDSLLSGSDCNDFGLLSGQKVLLRYVRSFKGNLISKTFYEVMKALRDDVNLEAFEEALKQKFVSVDLQMQLDILRQTKSDKLQKLLVNTLEPENLLWFWQGTTESSSNICFKFMSLYDRYEEFKEVCKSAGKEQLILEEHEAWKSVTQATGNQPEEVKYSKVGQDYPDVMAIRGLESFTNTQATDDSSRAVSEQSASLTLRDEKISVGLERQIDLPDHTEVIDQVKRVRFGVNEIVKIEQYDHGCSNAFTIDDEGKINEQDDLRQSFRLAVHIYNAHTQEIQDKEDFAIDRPIEFQNRFNKGNRTYLYQGEDQETFWFSTSAQGTVECKLLLRNEKRKRSVQSFTIDEGTQLFDHLKNPRYRKPTSPDQSLYFFATAVPRMLTINDRKLIAFSQHNFEGESVSASVYFYDLSSRREIVQVQNAEMFLNCFDQVNKRHRVLFRADQVVLSQTQKTDRRRLRVEQLISSYENAEDGIKDLSFASIDFESALAPDAEIATYNLSDLHDEAKVDAELPDADASLRKLMIDIDLDPNLQATSVHSHEISSCQQHRIAIQQHKAIRIYDILLQDDAISVKRICEKTTAAKDTMYSIVSQPSGSIEKLLSIQHKMDKDAPPTSACCFEVEGDETLFERHLEVQITRVLSIYQTNEDQSKFNLDVLDQGQSPLEILLLPDDEAKKYKKEMNNLKVSKTMIFDKKVKEDYVHRMVAIIKKPDVMRDWKVTVDFPLVFAFNRTRPKELIVASLVESSRKGRIFFKFKKNQQIFRVEPADPQEQNHSSKVVLLIGAQDWNKSGFYVKTKLHRLILQMNRPFSTDALFLKKSWKIIEKVELNDSFVHLFNERSRVEQLFVFQSRTRVNTFCTLIRVEDKKDSKLDQLQLIRPNYKEPKDLIDQSRAELVKIPIIRLQSGEIFYVKRDKHTSKFQIVECKISFDEVYSVWQFEEKVVYETVDDLKVLQVVRQNEQINDFDYNFDGSIDASDKVENDAFFLLDSNWNKRVRIERSAGQKTFREVETDNLNKVEGLTQWKQDFADSSSDPNESIVISQRAIVVSNQVFVLESGEQFTLFRDDLSIEEGGAQAHSQTYRKTVTVPQSDYLMSWRTEVNSTQHSSLSLIFENDPGRRNRSLVGPRHLRNILSVHIVSSELLLFRLGLSEDDCYWTYFSPNGYTFRITEELAERLYERSWTRVQTTIIKGIVCKVLLSTRDCASVLELSSRGELLSHKNYTFNNRISQRHEIFMNWRGNIVELQVDEESFLDNSDIVVTPSTDSNRDVLVHFTKCITSSEFIYCGNFLCWLAPNRAQIKFIKILEDASDTDAVETNQTQIRYIDLIKYGFKNIDKYGVVIDDIEPYLAAKCDPSGILSTSQLKELANRLQVSTKDKVKIFDLDSFVKLDANRLEEQKEDDQLMDTNSKSVAAVAGELLATESLLDPQFYVTTEIVCATVDKMEDTVVHQYLKVTQQGNFVIHMQSTKFLSLSSGSNNKRYRKVLGIYAEFAGIDYLEALRLQKLSEMNKVPKRIDGEALFASFGQNTMFTLLPYNRQNDGENNPKILKAIHDCLVDWDFEEIEDVEGYNRPNPRSRRLSDILFKNTRVVHQRNAENELCPKIRNPLVQVQNDSIGVRDQLLKIGNMNSSFAITKGLGNQQDLGKMLSNCTNEIVESLNHVYEDFECGVSIDQLPWPENLEMFTTNINSMHLTSKQIAQCITDVHGNDLHSTAVDIKLIQMNWFFRDGSTFIDFATMMTDGEKPDELFTTDFVQCILNFFWSTAQWQVLKRRFAPYVAMAFMQMCFMYQVLKYRSMQEAYDNSTAGIVFMSLVCAALISLNGYLEFHQLWGKRLEYLKDPWNYIDWLGLLSSAYFIFAVWCREGTRSEEEPTGNFGALRVLASFASLTLCMKVYDWMRVFEELAFFIQLIKRTLEDIRYFIVIFVVALFVFGIPMLYIELEQLDEPKDEQVDEQQDDFEAATNFFWALISKAFWGQYLIALGEFPLDDWADKPYEWVMKIFMVLTTFFTMITILNMLVAIMSETFGEVFGAKKVNSTRTKLEFIANMEKGFIHEFKSSNMSQSYLMVIRPAYKAEEKEDPIEKKLKEIEDQVNKNQLALEGMHTELNDEVRRRFDVLQTMISQLAPTSSAQSQQVKEIMDEGEVIQEEPVEDEE